MNHWICKLTSRKFWMALAGLATGVAMVLEGDATQIDTLAGAIAATVSAATYIVTEGKVDAAREGGK